MRLSKNDNDGGWIEAKRKNSKTGSKDSSIKSSASTTSQSSGKQVEKMKRIIREEGRDARNLLYWTVSPKQDTSKNDKNNNTRHLQLYGRSKSETRISASENARGRTPRQDDRKFHDPKKDEVECIRARYWGYLFDNLRQAVDKIYLTCEDDQSIEECKETLLMMEAFRHDFIELKNLLELKKTGDFDKSVDKKRGISFELRKTSPAPRKMDNEFKPKTPQKTPRSPPQRSWAEKVRSNSKGSGDEPIVPKLKLGDIGNDEDDMEINDDPKTPTNEDNEIEWGDVMNTEEKGVLNRIDYREPGRLATVHEKLMSPSRKKPEMNSENVRLQIEIKQKDAAQRREDIKRNKAQRVRKATEKVENAQKIKKSVQVNQRQRLDEKLKRAALQRNSKHLDVKLRAKDESQKVREVNFIQGLEQDIKRSESVKKIKKYEKQTEKHAMTIEEQKELKARENELKELAVIERKRKLESKRQSWVVELNNKRNQRNSAINLKLEEEKKKLIQAVKEKEQKREEILNAKRIAQEKEAEESKNKIKIKQLEAERRRQEELDKKKEKAAELSGYSQMSPRSIDRQSSNQALSSLVSRKLCFNSDKDDDESRDENGNITTVNTKKNNKKKLKKIRGRLNQRRGCFEEKLNGDKPPTPSKGKLGKLIGDIARHCTLQGRDGKDTVWPSNRQIALDRSLVELIRLNGPANVGDVIPLTQSLSDLVQLQNISPKTLKNIADLWRRCRPISSASLMCSNIPHSVVDIVNTDAREFLSQEYGDGDKLKSKGGYKMEKWLMLDSLAWLMIQCYEAPTGSDLAHQACLDTVSYTLLSDVYDRFFECSSIEAGNYGALPSAVFAFLTASIRSLLLRPKAPLWSTEFLAMLERTELLGAVSILYGSIVLDHNSNGSSAGITLTPESERTAMLILQAINNAALLDCALVQRILSPELICGQFRSVIACLLTSNVPDNIKHEAILAVGYFVLQNEENQLKITQGEQPTILQQLCMLPFKYFSDQKLKSILFPTMIASCFESVDAMSIVAQDVSLVHFASFLTESLGEFKQQEDTLLNDVEKGNTLRADRWLLLHRFPFHVVGAAIKEFLSTTAH